ncbi:BPSS1780 family membrane protein [Roseateles violae]|uniref:BPSS1780 family membrane protein n=1 Tax=Roseateles violae TaxID=3058042 RepID=A0ABT8DQR7_9BURK|nr:BPSS1780 family membrane protein [Pelomonas sp. PFR6]MDN3920695.1 BPSS1780 family membrane protein [Pelomonas sp. PFR6]
MSSLPPSPSAPPGAPAPSTAMLLHLQTVPPRNGGLWIRHGFKVFQRKPLALTGLLAIFIFAAIAMMLLPFVGIVLLLMAWPLLSLGFMLATHLVLQNRTPTAAVYLAPLKLTRQRRNTQLQLCGAYALATLLISLLSSAVDGGSFDALQRLLASGAPPEQVAEAAADPALFWGAMTRLTLAALLSVPFWHAPALVHWGGQGLMQSLFSSTLGVWRNKGAFVVNSLLWSALVIGAALLCSLLGGLLGAPQLLPLLIAPLGLVLSTVFYASLYFTFVDCFMFGTPRELPQS